MRLKENTHKPPLGSVQPLSSGRTYSSAHSLIHSHVTLFNRICILVYSIYCTLLLLDCQSHPAPVSAMSRISSILLISLAVVASYGEQTAAPRHIDRKMTKLMLSPATRLYCRFCSPSTGCICSWRCGHGSWCHTCLDWRRSGRSIHIRHWRRCVAFSGYVSLLVPMCRADDSCPTFAPLRSHTATACSNSQFNWPRMHRLLS